VCVNCASTDLWGAWVGDHPGLPGEYSFAHQDGKRPRKGPLFGGARLTIEPGSDFPIGVNNLGFRVAARSPAVAVDSASDWTGRPPVPIGTSSSGER